RGYRFIADATVPEVASKDPLAPSPVQDEQISVSSADVFRRSIASLVAGLLGGALLLALVLIFNLAGARDWLRGRRSIHSIAVLPLENLSGDPDQEYFADGMTDELITNLAELGNVRVVSRTSVMRYKKTNKSLPEIGRELNADAV